VLFGDTDNVHSLIETVAGHRLTLGFALLHQDPGLVADAAAPIPGLDPNFPLGTAILFRVPWALGLDPVLFGRLHALGWLLVGTGCVVALVRPLAGHAVAAIAAASLWGIPAVVRGGMVSGEEAPCAGLLLLGLTVLVSAAESGREERSRRRRAFAGGLLAGGAVLFRLDALIFLPGFVTAAVFLLGRRDGLLATAAAALWPALHVLASWATYGDPLRFARRAREVSSTRVAEGTFEPIGDLVLALQGQVGLLALVVAGVALAVGLLHPLRVGRALAGQSLAAVVAFSVVVLAGVLDPRIDRYFVPLLVLLGPAAVVGAAAGAARWRPEAATAAAAAIGLTILLPGTAQSVRAAHDATYPSGLREASAWLAEHAPGERVMTNRWAAELSLEGGLAPWAFRDLRTAENGFPEAAAAGEQIAAFGADLIVRAGPEDAGVRAIEALLDDRHELRFARGAVRIWGPRSPATAPRRPLTVADLGGRRRRAPGLAPSSAICVVAARDDARAADFRDGLALAVEDAADPTDPRRTTEIVAADSFGRIEALPEALSVCARAGARVVIGPAIGELSLPLLPIAAQHDWVLLVPQLGLGEAGPWSDAFVVLAGAPSEMGRTAADDAAARGGTRAAVLSVEGTFGDRVGAAFARNFGVAGRSVETAISLPMGRPEAWRSAAATFAPGTDTIFLVGPPDLVTAAIPALPPGAEIWIADWAVQPEVLEVAALDAVARLHGVVQPMPEPWFVARFRERYGRFPEPAAGLGYDAMRLALHAIRTANSTATVDLLRALRTTPDLGAAFGTGRVLAEGPIVRLETTRRTVLDGAVSPDGTRRFEPRR